jgi:deoxyhypusine synthase
MIQKGKSKFLRQPLQHLNLKETQSLFDLVQAFQHTSFQSWNVYKCFEVYREMLNDPTCVIFMGLSGAMIPGGMRKVIRDMIDMKLIDVIVSTGANVFHDLFESFGYRHYVGFEEGDDDCLRKHRIARVYDALMDDHEIHRVIYLFSKVPKELEERVVSDGRETDLNPSGSFNHPSWRASRRKRLFFHTFECVNAVVSRMTEMSKFLFTHREFNTYSHSTTWLNIVSNIQ